MIKKIIEKLDEGIAHCDKKIKEINMNDIKLGTEEEINDMTEEERGTLFDRHMEILFRISSSLLEAHQEEEVTVQASFKDREGNNKVIRVVIDTPSEDEDDAA